MQNSEIKIRLLETDWKLSINLYFDDKKLDIFKPGKKAERRSLKFPTDLEEGNVAKILLGKHLKFQGHFTGLTLKQ